MSAEENSILLTGPIFMGAIFGWCLLGALFTQIYVYFCSYPDDSRVLKCLVAGLFVLELLQTSLMTHYAWEMLLGKWGNVNVVGLPWSSATFSPMIGLISMIVQCYYAWRINVLRGATNYPKAVQTVSILIFTVAVLQGCAGIYGGISFGISSTWENMASLTRIVELWLGGSFACDVLIAVSMIAILAEAGRDSSSDRISVMVNKLVIHAIETGAVTAITAMIDLVLFELYKDTGIHQAPAAVLGKLYTNALMVSLNGRKQRLSSFYPVERRSALHFSHSSIYTPGTLTQIRTSPTLTGGTDIELAIRDATPSHLEAQVPKSRAPILVKIPESSIDSISEVSDIGNKFRKTLDSPV